MLKDDEQEKERSPCFHYETLERIRLAYHHTPITLSPAWLAWFHTCGFTVGVLGKRSPVDCAGVLANEEYQVRKIQSLNFGGSGITNLGAGVQICLLTLLILLVLLFLLDFSILWIIFGILFQFHPCHPSHHHYPSLHESSFVLKLGSNGPWP